jgi:site-specific DNA-cytosine methylase
MVCSVLCACRATVSRGLSVPCRYTVFTRVLNACAWAPQQRSRLYFVGFRKDTGSADRFVWPDPQSPCPQTIRDVLEPTECVSPEHTLSDHKWEKVQLCRKTNGILSRRLARLDGQARTLCSNYRRGYSHMSEFVPCFTDDGSTVDHQATFDVKYPDHGKKDGQLGEEPANDAGGVEDSGGVANAVVDEEGEDAADDDDGAVAAGPNCNPRFYTPRECARIMGFPETFEIEDVCKSKHRIYHQLGNAVVPPVVEAIMRAVLETGVFGDTARVA